VQLFIAANICVIISERLILFAGGAVNFLYVVSIGEIPSITEAGAVLKGSST